MPFSHSITSMMSNRSTSPAPSPHHGPQDTTTSRKHSTTSKVMMLSSFSIASSNNMLFSPSAAAAAHHRDGDIGCDTRDHSTTTMSKVMSITGSAIPPPSIRNNNNPSSPSSHNTRNSSIYDTHPYLLNFLDPETEQRYFNFQYVDNAFIPGKMFCFIWSGIPAISFVLFLLTPSQTTLLTPSSPLVACGGSARTSAPHWTPRSASVCFLTVSSSTERSYISYSCLLVGPLLYCWLSSPRGRMHTTIANYLGVLCFVWSSCNAALEGVYRS